MKAVVIGCGRWGTFISWYLDSIGHDVTLYGRSSSKHMQELMETRKNDERTFWQSNSILLRNRYYRK